MKIKIYALIDPITNQLRYIGQTKRNLNKRLKEHINYKKNNLHKINWINKLKDVNLIPIISLIEEVELCEWQEKEIYWIDFYQKLGYELLNLTKGGDGINGYKWSDENKEIKSEQMKGEGNHFYGKKHSPETIELLRKINKRIGDENGMFNKKHSQESKNKISNTRKKKYENNEYDKLYTKKIFQYDTNLNLLKVWSSLVEFSKFYKISVGNVSSFSKHNSGKCVNYKIILNGKKKVDMYSLDGEFLKTFESIKDASNETGYDSSLICKFCKSIYKCKNYIFKYNSENNGYIISFNKIK